MSDNTPVLLVHCSPSGRIFINHVGERDPFDPFEAPADIAASLLDQSDVFRLAVTEYDDVKVSDLRRLAEQRELASDGEPAAVISRLWAADRRTERDAALAAEADADSGVFVEPEPEPPTGDVKPPEGGPVSDDENPEVAS